MTRRFFTSLIIGAAALIGIPMKGQAARATFSREQAGEMFVRRMELDATIRSGEPMKAIVKWNEWREWQDFETRENFVAWDCRLALVPEAALATAERMDRDEKSSVVTFFFLDDARLREEKAVFYSYFSYGLMSYAEYETDLRHAVAAGGAHCHRPEGHAPKRVA